MTAPAGGDDVRLLDVPDLAGTLRERWPRLAVRGATALALPVLVTLYAKALDFYGPVAALGLPLEFLQAGPFAYEAKLIWFVVLCLVGGCWLAGPKGPRLVLALCAGAILWAGFIYSRLMWTRLFLPGYDPLQVAAPTPAAWGWAFAILAAGIAALLAEALLDARDAQAQRGLPEEATRASARAAAQATLTALGVGAALAALLAVLFWSLRPALAALPVRVNPVILLFGLGAALALALALVARRRGVDVAEGGEPPPAP